MKPKAPKAGQTGAEIEVTAEMLDAGFVAMKAAHITDEPLEADREALAKIFRAMVLARIQK